jgi:hypothetical protein
MFPPLNLSHPQLNFVKICLEESSLIRQKQKATYLFLFIFLTAKMICVENWYVWDKSQRIETSVGRGRKLVQVLGLGLQLNL